MQNRKIIVLIILGIAAVFSLIYGITASSGGKRARAAKPSLVSEPETIQPVRKLLLKERNAAKTQYKSWNRNPFIQEKMLGPKSSKLVLNGIIWNEKNPRVLINNTILSKGDRIGTNTVVDIKQKSVILNNGAEDFEIKLH